MLKGLLAAGVTMGVAAVFPETLAFPFYTAVLGLVVGFLPGVAAAAPEGGRPGLQMTAAVAVLGVGLTGLWLSPLYLAGAWALHALWALLHGFTALGDGAPEGYPSFTASYDLMTAAFVAYMSLAAV